VHLLSGEDGCSPPANSASTAATTSSRQVRAADLRPPGKCAVQRSLGVVGFSRHRHAATCGGMCYSSLMSGSVSVRNLRNEVSAVLRRVEGGERLTVTVDRRPVAEIVPVRRHRTVPAADALAVASRHAADRGLLGDVRGLLADTTDDL